MKHVHGHRKALGIDEMGRSESGSRDSFGTFFWNHDLGRGTAENTPASVLVFVDCGVGYRKER